MLDGLASCPFDQISVQFAVDSVLMGSFFFFADFFVRGQREVRVNVYVIFRAHKFAHTSVSHHVRIECIDKSIDLIIFNISQSTHNIGMDWVRYRSNRLLLFIFFFVSRIKVNTSLNFDVRQLLRALDTNETYN